MGRKCGGVAEYSQCPPVQWLEMLSRGDPSCVRGSGTSPWGCEEARSISNSRCCVRSHSLPNTAGPLATLRPAGQSAGVKACVARVARAGQAFSRSLSRNSLLKGKQRGGLAGVSWPVVPGSSFCRGTAGPLAGALSLVRPLLQLTVLWVGSAWCEGLGPSTGSCCHLQGAVNWRWEPRCPFLWGSRPPEVS